MLLRISNMPLKAHVTTYHVEVAKKTAGLLVVKFGVKAAGDSNANRAVLLVF